MFGRKIQKQCVQTEELYNASQSTPRSMMSRSATVQLIGYNALMGNGAIVHPN